jgi:hypothetical protein
VSQFLTVSQAAPLMRLSRRQALRRLVELHRASPALGLLSRACHGGFRGVYRVSAKALARILSGEGQDELQDLSSRVGLLESDRATMQARIGLLEKKISQR